MKADKQAMDDLAHTLEVIREGLELFSERALGFDEDTDHLIRRRNETLMDRLQHAYDWRTRYFEHLLTGGDKLTPPDRWAMHHEHVLVMRFESLLTENDVVNLHCETCDDGCQQVDHDPSKHSKEPKLVGGWTYDQIVAEHVGHTMSIRRDEAPVAGDVAMFGLGIGLDCVTCGAERENGYAVFSSEVSEWFDDWWNG